MHRADPLDWIALNLLPGLGPISVRRALARYDGDPARVAHRVPARELLALARGNRVDPGRIVEARRDLRHRARRELRLARELEARIVPCDDPDFPAELGALDDSPLLLYVRGELSAGVVRAAVVGSRRATRYGRRVALGLGAGLAQRGVEIVSGGARGIDTAAHLGALEGGGRTLSILGSGLARPYPAENVSLFERIAASGAVLSEFPLDHPPRPESFPRRNRLISALSAAVVVVEAAARSGSLVTAEHALDQGREVLAVPGPVSSPVSVGCHRLIRQGATLVQNVDDVLEGLSPMYRSRLEAPASVAPAARAGPLDPDEERLLELLDPVEPVHIDELVESSPLGIARVQAALLGLELAGRIEGLPGGYYRILASGPPRI